MIVQKSTIAQIFSGLSNVVKSSGNAIKASATGIGTGIKTALTGVATAARRYWGWFGGNV
ncbi:hypothetical protein ODV97_17970 [Enterococcus gallinarum]|nr:hypothetical protein [Enterococcus gallinarum]